jgi:hypothetical protein
MSGAKGSDVHLVKAGGHEKWLKRLGSWVGRLLLGPAGSDVDSSPQLALEPVLSVLISLRHLH